MLLWRYIPVRRLALLIEQSLYNGLDWTVVLPNREPLWQQLRQLAEAFLHGLFRDGAFAGSTAEQAYFVRCGRETMTALDVDRGTLHFSIGFAPLRPAEFVILSFELPVLSGS